MISCEGLGNGGVQSVIMTIVKSLHSDYIFDALLFTSEKRYYDDAFEGYGGKIYRIPRYEGNNRVRNRLDYYIRGHKIYSGVKNILQKQSYDIVHCHNEEESGIIVKAAFEMGIPVRIVHSHIILQKGNIIRKFIDDHRRELIEKYASYKVGCSSEACRSLFKDSKYTIVIYNSYDDRKYYIRPETLDKKRDFVLSQIGRICTVKNQLFSLDIIHSIKRQYPKVKFFIVGNEDPEYKKELCNKILRMNLSDNVYFLPGDNDFTYVYEQSSGVLFPSLHEGFGIVLIEAQAMGVPCYASNHVPDSTNCGGVTYIQLENNPEEWAKKIIDDYNRTNGRHFVYDVQRFSQAAFIHAIQSIYESEK